MARLALGLGRRSRLLLLIGLATACSAPDLRIVESQAVTTAGVGASDARVADSGPDAADDPADGGDGGFISEPPDRGDPSPADAGQAGASGPGAAGGAGAAAMAGVSGAAGAAGSGTSGSGVAPSADAGAADAATHEPNPCIVWKSLRANDEAPEGAVEGGLETALTVSIRQYVCRTRPTGLDYAVPGKMIFGRGCLVAYRRDGKVMTYMVPADQPVEVLTAAPGCTFSWQTATTSTLPSRALDLGDPPGGGNYACHGYYTSAISSGIQIGVVVGANDTPAHNECWFESYLQALQPQDPTRFEVLAQD